MLANVKSLIEEGRNSLAALPQMSNLDNRTRAGSGERLDDGVSGSYRTFEVIALP